MNTIDLSYRPDTYWPESLTPEQLLSRIRGKERQDIARLTYAACGFSGLDAFLARGALTQEEREAWGRVHPLCLGGEFLPDTKAGEVEIARLSMQSTTGDQPNLVAVPDWAYGVQQTGSFGIRSCHPKVDSACTPIESVQHQEHGHHESNCDKPKRFHLRAPLSSVVEFFQRRLVIGLRGSRAVADGQNEEKTEQEAEQSVHADKPEQ